MLTGHKRNKYALENIYDAVIHDIFVLQNRCEYFDLDEVIARVAETIPNPSPELLRGGLERFVHLKWITASTFSGTLLYKRIAQPRLPTAEPVKED